MAAKKEKKKTKKAEAPEVNQEVEQSLEELRGELDKLVEEADTPVPASNQKKKGKKAKPGEERLTGIDLNTLREMRQEVKEEMEKKDPEQEAIKKVKKSKSKSSPAPEGDTISLKEICGEMDVDPKDARKKLRKSDIAKPSGRWEWPVDHADVAKIRELLG